MALRLVEFEIVVPGPICNIFISFHLSIMLSC